MSVFSFTWGEKWEVTRKMVKDFFLLCDYFLKTINAVRFDISHKSDNLTTGLMYSLCLALLHSVCQPLFIKGRCFWACWSDIGFSMLQRKEFVRVQLKTKVFVATLSGHTGWQGEKSLDGWKMALSNAPPANNNNSIFVFFLCVLWSSWNDGVHFQMFAVLHLVQNLLMFTPPQAFPATAQIGLGCWIVSFCMLEYVGHNASTVALSETMCQTLKLFADYLNNCCLYEKGVWGNTGLAYCFSYSLNVS